ncbi:hypothetical protein Tco_0256598 [Tanacetum coccineum]
MERMCRSSQIVVEDYFASLVAIAKGIKNMAKTCVRLIILKRTDKAKTRESSLVGSELVQETTDKEKLKAASDCQKSYVDNMHANLHVHVEEIKVDTTLRFAKEPIEIINRESCYVAISTLIWASEVVSSGFLIVKLRRDSKRGPKFTWEHEDHMKAKYFPIVC